jgi:hypothetical protein
VKDDEFDNTDIHPGTSQRPGGSLCFALADAVLKHKSPRPRAQAILDVWKWKPSVPIRQSTDEEWKDWTNPITGGFCPGIDGAQLKYRREWEDNYDPSDSPDEPTPETREADPDKIEEDVWYKHPFLGRVKVIRKLTDRKHAWVERWGKSATKKVPQLYQKSTKRIKMVPVPVVYDRERVLLSDLIP